MRASRAAAASTWLSGGEPLHCVPLPPPTPPPPALKPHLTRRAAPQLLRTLLALTLVCILGLGAAALIAGPNKYMTYYVNKGAVTDELNFYRIRSGRPPGGWGTLLLLAAAHGRGRLCLRLQDRVHPLPDPENSTLSSPTADNLKHDLKVGQRLSWPSRPALRACGHVPAGPAAAAQQQTPETVPSRCRAAAGPACSRLQPHQPQGPSRARSKAVPSAQHAQGSRLKLPPVRRTSTTRCGSSASSRPASRGCPAWRPCGSS